MKNIFLLPTPEASRILQASDVIELLITPWLAPLKNINRELYITADDEINSDTPPCWCINTIKNTFEEDIVHYQGAMPLYHFRGFKRIILTTDKKLIEIEAARKIPEDFLEWYIKNTFCDYVKITPEPMFKGYLTNSKDINHGPFYGNIINNIDFPKEEEEKCTCKIGEPYSNLCCKVHGKLIKNINQTTEEYTKQGLEKHAYQFKEEEKSKGKIHSILEIARAVMNIEIKEPMQKMAEKYAATKSSSPVFRKAHYDDFIAGFTAAEQTTFNNAEVLELLIKMNNWSTLGTGQKEVTNWFQHHKKK